MTFIRPNLPYANQSLPNDNRFRILTRSLEAPPTDIMLDSEFNALTDGLNDLATTVAGIIVGAIPGTDDPNNANFVLSTTGAVTQWIQVSDINIAPQSISANKLIPSSITNAQIGAGTILGNNIANQTITNSNIALTTIMGNNIADQTITATQIANNTITATQIAPSTITAAKLANNAVTTPAILDGNVTTSKLAANAVTAAKIANQTITATQIANNTITATQIADQTITFTQIANDTITFTQINPNFVATKAQQQAASSSSVYVSPATQQNHPSALKASVLFDGSNGNILVSYNVASVARISSGVYEITFNAAFSSGSYVTSVTAENNTMRSGQVDTTFSSTATKIRVRTVDVTGAASDSTYVNCLFYGTLA